MSNIIGHTVIDGVPYINGKKATKDEDMDPLFKKLDFSEWKCPECGSYLADGSFICLNACHLSAAGFQRFQAGLQRGQRNWERSKKLIDEL